MPDQWDFFHGRLHILGHFDDALKCGIAGHHSFEEIAEDPFNLAIDQVIDVEFVQTTRPFKLPRSRAADNYLGLEFFDDRMGDNL